MTEKRIGLLGGSFNPVHNGHLRMALQVCHALSLDRVDLIPAKSPPHKSGRGLLPFELRVRMLESSVQGRDFLRVCEMEGRRKGPSYTVDTLKEYRRDNPEAGLVFILGLNDIPALSAWHSWAEIFSLADMAVVERAGLSGAVVHDFLSQNLPDAFYRESSASWRVKGATLCLVSMPRMDLSSSLLRWMWLKGMELDFLLPDCALDILRRERRTVTTVWEESALDGG
ncbi:MAG: nicotinate (nicotinamide) nucleotide adenylyltransferase [Desulfonatronovibrionaceae bacterium]